MSLWSFQGPRGLERPVLQNSTAYVHRAEIQHSVVEVDVVPGEPVSRTAEAIDGTGAYRSNSSGIPRKEVIQPQLPLRLPCYDFVPVTGPALERCLLAVSELASGVTSSHDVTGGVYKARERIHRTMADARLLATPTSCGRVAAHNPNCDRL